MERERPQPDETPPRERGATGLAALLSGTAGIVAIGFTLVVLAVVLAIALF
jgi:hypothetical protein